MAEEKKETVYTDVQMTDGRTVRFAGKRRMVKEVLVDREAGTVSVRFDFVNGETRTFDVSGSSVTLECMGHGASQKIGDAGALTSKDGAVIDIEDIIIAVDEQIARLEKGEWRAESTRAGDSFAGANIVIRAICEVSGKPVAEIKEFLQGKLDDSKAREEAGGPKALTRKELYDSFRRPGTKTAAVIDRLEKEKLAKSGSDVADGLLSELGV